MNTMKVVPSIDNKLKYNSRYLDTYVTEGAHCYVDIIETFGNIFLHRGLVAVVEFNYQPP